MVTKSLSELRWTPKLEATLETLLVNAHFDFNKAASEFERLLNRDEATNYTVFKFDGKAVQLKWTDIEIRRHVIPKMNSQAAQAQEEFESTMEKEAEDEDLPPLQEEDQKQTSSKLISYDSDSGSDDNGPPQATTEPSTSSYVPLGDLEALD